MVRTLLLAGASALAVTTPPQSPVELFSCVVSSRLPSATLTYEYQLLENPAQATVTFHRVARGDRDVIEMIYRPIPTIDVITDLDPVSLIPLRGRLIPGGKETGRWEREKDEIRYAGAGGGYVVQTGSGPVVFGAVHLLPFLAATVDWHRCPSVGTRQLVAATRQIETVVLTRKASGRLAHQGQSRDVYEIAVERGGVRDTIWVTQGATPTPLQFTVGTGGLFRFVSNRLP